jgi:hypothetical protein
VRRVALAAALAAALAGGCGRGAGVQPPPDHNSPGIDMEVSPRVARPGQTLRLVVRDRRARRLEGGLAYRLERWEGGWRWLNRDMAFALILVAVEPGRPYTQRIELPGDAEAGLYRVTKNFRAGGEYLQVAARFNVTG